MYGLHTHTYVKIHAIYTSWSKNLARTVFMICIISKDSSEGLCMLLFFSFFQPGETQRPLFTVGLPQCWELGCSLPGVDAPGRMDPWYITHGQAYGITMSRFFLKTHYWNFWLENACPKNQKMWRWMVWFRWFFLSMFELMFKFHVSFQGRQVASTNSNSF